MLDIVIEPRKALIAPGLAVKRILPFRLRRVVGPFIFMDHAGPVSVPVSEAVNLDVLPHPHIGLSLVTIVPPSLGIFQIKH
jgi:redox-sensitive bicupin YhaK (pirin superfamily)